jgi:hypothetical protein
MKFLTEQHLTMAKLLREKAASLTDPTRDRVIKSSNGFLVCAALGARDRGFLSLSGFDWEAVMPDWSFVDEQIGQLTPPLIVEPSVVPQPQDHELN